jgi:hypothetical protein
MSRSELGTPRFAISDCKGSRECCRIIDSHWESGLNRFLTQEQTSNWVKSGNREMITASGGASELFLFRSVWRPEKRVKRIWGQPRRIDKLIKITR